MVIQSSFYDPVLGLDTHIVGIPAPPAPVPVPTPIPIPFVGLVFDPLGLVVGAAMGMAMSGSPGVVLVNSMPVTNCGTEVSGILGVPHLPVPGIMFMKTGAPVYTSNDAELYFGSLDTTLGGSLGVRLGDVALSCGDPVRLPTSVVMAVPKGMPVLNMNPMVPDLEAIAMAAGMKALGALVRRGASVFRRFRAGSAFFQRLSRRLGGCTPPATASRWRAMYHRAVRTVTGHPVDVVTGNFFTDAVDATLPGPIPLVLERVYESAGSSARRSLGWGWNHTLDESFWLERGRAVVRLGDGREVEFPLWDLPGRRIRVGDHVDRVIHKMRLACTAPGRYEILFWDQRLVHEYGAVPGGDANVARLLKIRSLDREHAIELFYDARGVLEHVRDSGGRLIAFEHDTHGRLVALKLPVARGRGWYTHRRYLYDPRGNLVEVRDALGHAWRYQYKGHLLVQETDRAGLSFYFQYDGTGSLAKCVRTWGDGGIYDHVVHYDPKGMTTVVEDSLGSSTAFTYDERNRLVKVVDAVGAVTEQDHDPDTGGTTRSSIPGRGKAESKFDAFGNLIEVTNELGASFQITYDTNHRATRIVDHRGREWRWVYDAFGRTIESTSPSGRSESVIWQQGLVVAHRDASGAITRFQHDARKMVCRVETPLGATVEHEWDELGRMVKTRDGRKTPARLVYDVEGRLVEAHTVAGTLVRHAYDAEGHVVESRDAVRHQRFGYGHYHRLAWREDAGDRFTFTYDTEDRVVAVTNPAGESYGCRRDAVGNVIEEIGFDGGRRRHVLSASGQPSLTIHPSGQSTESTYDALGRLVLAQHSDGTFVRLAYDELGGLVRAENESAVVTLARDADGRVVSERVDEHEVSSRYDARGDRDELRTSLGMRVLTSVDALGLPRALFFDAESITRAPDVAFERDPLGHETARRFRSGVAVEWRRDDAGRPTSRHTVSVASPSPGGSSRPGVDSERRELDARSYVWRSDDQIAAIIDAASGPRAFEHDARGRLVRDHHQGQTNTRALDVLGNVYRSTDRRDRQYAPGGRIRRDGDTVFEHDADGNLTRKRGADGSEWSFSWSAGGLLREVERPDRTRVRFAYDAFARRIGKSTLRLDADGREHVEHETRYVWDGHVVVHELDSRVGRTDWYWEPSSFTPVAKEHGGRRWSIASDHLGTPTEMYDELGELAWKMQLDAFGVPRFEAGVASDCPWRWPGQYADPETGLSYNWHRYFDPELGSYIADDPLGLTGGFALQAYVEDPFAELDPLGLVTEALMAAMAEAGRPVTPGHTAHHIIQRNGGTYANQSEAILQRANPAWTRDSASNGASLWGTAETQVTVAGHPGRGVSGARPDGYHAGTHLHGDAAQRRIFERLSRAERMGLDPERVLEQIGRRQETGRWRCP